ncbi:MAG TPA: MFS transporter [Terriglobales bacterium]|nr:MFS transporter [Terriglobales bacterium]
MKTTEPEAASDASPAREHAASSAVEGDGVALNGVAAQGPLGGVAVEEPVAPQLPPVSLAMTRMASALRHRNFRLFWTGNFLSNIGTWMQNVAQGWLVLELSNSAFWLGVVGFASSAPMLVFTLLGGVIADQMDRRRLLMRTQAAMMVFAFVLAALTWFKVVNLPEILLLAFATGVAMSLNAPSYQALVPQLVPRKDLTNAIALNSAQFNMSRVIGPTLGGFAMAWFGVAGNFFLNGLSFLAVLVALARMEYPPAAANDDGAGMLEKLGEGFRYLFGQRSMLMLVTLVGLASIFGVPYLMFLPLFARDILGVGERGLGLLMAASGLGAFFGAVTVAWRGRVWRRGRFVTAWGTVFLASVILFSFSRWFALSLALQLVAGYSMILMVATVNSLLQHLSREEMRGRVMSMYATAFLGFAPVGSLIAGSLAGVMTAPVAIAAMSALALIVTLFLYFMRPELRCLD